MSIHLLVPGPFGTVSGGYIYDRRIVEGLRALGVRKLRTMLSRDNVLILSFFRSQGMRTGPFIPLEMDLDD